MRCQSPSCVSAATDTSLCASIARDTLLAQLKTYTKSFFLYTYMINEAEDQIGGKDTFCRALLDMQERGVNVTVLVSGQLIGDFPGAEPCYDRLRAAGVPVRYTAWSEVFAKCYNFNHQKYWIGDRKDMGISSGNWDQHDYPPVDFFPPHPTEPYVSANRGQTVIFHDAPAIIDIYHRVATADYAAGTDTPAPPIPQPPASSELL